MQAVISLCHFCEKHGPRVVVTCQPMRSLPNPVISPTPGGYERIVEGVNLSATTSQEPEILPRFYGDCTRAYHDFEPRCGACTSLGPQQCLLSNDHPNKTSYVTSQAALKAEVQKRLYKACVRSLTCEVAVPPADESEHRTAAIRIGSGNDAFPNLDKIKEEEGHVSFGDVELGMCLAYRFRIHDSKARGRKRLFSLLVLTHDAASLSVHFDFFLIAMKKMKDVLQMKAYEIFAKETEKLTLPSHQHASVNSQHLDKLIRTKVEIDPTRTLQVLTGTKEIFADLHRFMMWTLRTQTLRFEDQLMEGIPTQDMLVLGEMPHENIVKLDLDRPNQAELTLLQLRNLRYIAKELDEQGELDLLIVHVITGGQIVVQSSHKLLAKQFILAISNLLPIGCLRINNDAERYHQPTEFNMLGCDRSFAIPSYVLRVVVTPKEGETNHLEECRLQIDTRPAQQTTKIPKVSARFKQLLLDDEVPITALKATMNSTREEWLARAKLLYQLEEQAMRDARFRENVGNNILRYCFPATENDRDLLKFWQNGLAQSYRVQVINTVVENIRHN